MSFTRISAMRCGCFSFGDKSFGFSDNKNDLIRETDARGNETGYTVDEETSRNEEVVDRCGNKTAYEYDEAGNTTKVTGKDADDVEQAHVEYAYNSIGQMIGEKWVDAANSVMAHYRYVYDGQGNIVIKSKNTRH